MWSYRYLSRMDLRVIPVILALMAISLLAVSSASQEGTESSALTPLATSQLQWFGLGWLTFFIAAGLDYHKLREWTWLLYGLTLLALVGVFFSPAIQNVHRWYKVPLLGFSIQPSEAAKLVVVLALSWFLERCRATSWSWRTSLQAALIAGVPFLLILKQPDLGTALVIPPIALVIFYIGDINPTIVRLGAWAGGLLLLLVSCFLLEIIPHEEARPVMTMVMRSYQYERLKPDDHHHRAAATAIALGGVTGTGWHQGEYIRGGWLPTAATDSVFATFGEEFGLLGLTILLALFYALIYFCFQATAIAKDAFGRLLVAGITVYLAVHILINVGMMTGFLPITGVPLILISYGGSSLLATMLALGIVQSVYSRRFMF